MSLVSTEWLANNLSNLKILDCSWHMPNVNRNSYKEYISEHIENAIFFDLDKNYWEKIVSSMGILNNDRIVIYDNSDVISSCRCWYSFIYFGHHPSLVYVLNGGMKKWKLENRPTTNFINQIKVSNYIAEERKELVKNKKQIDQNILDKKFELVDARSRNRFDGKEPEPRKGIRSGSIPNSFCLPFGELINEDHTFKNIEQILKKFNNVLGSKTSTNIVFSCGSGVTAAVLALAYSLINNKYDPKIYDGSWVEYGKIK